MTNETFLTKNPEELNLSDMTDAEFLNYCNKIISENKDVYSAYILGQSHPVLNDIYKELLNRPHITLEDSLALPPTISVIDYIGS
jgi:hypothetical protein